MAGLLSDDGTVATLLLQGLSECSSDAPTKYGKRLQLKVLILHSTGTTKYRSTASSQTIFHLGENGATGWLVVLIVRILGVLKSGGITTVLKNQYHTNGNIEFVIRTIRAALDVTSSFVTYETLFSSTSSAIS